MKAALQTIVQKLRTISSGERPGVGISFDLVSGVELLEKELLPVEDAFLRIEPREGEEVVHDGAQPARQREGVVGAEPLQHELFQQLFAHERLAQCCQR